MDRIVIDSSPLILLCKADLEPLLFGLFDAVIVPEGVLDEIAAHTEDGIAQRVRMHPRFKKVPAPLDPIVQGWDMGKGETEVISFARQFSEHLPVLDDAEAKACCHALGLRAMGTGSILVLAKRQGMLPSVREALESLREKGMWVSEKVIRMLCRKAGEPF